MVHAGLAVALQSGCNGDHDDGRTEHRAITRRVHGTMRAREADLDGYVERDGIKVFFESFGEGEPAVLLLPTWQIVHSRIWKSQVPFLARRRRVVTFDGRGSGRSDRPLDPTLCTPRHTAADAIQVLDAAGVERAAVVGFSWGGGPALVLAAEHQDRIDGLVLIGVGLPSPQGNAQQRSSFGEPFTPDPQEWDMYNASFWKADYEAFLRFFFLQVVNQPHSTKHLQDLHGWGEETTPEVLAATCWGVFGTPEDPTFAFDDAKSVMANVRCPSLVIHGVDDAIVGIEHAAANADTLGAEMVVMAGTGHAPHVREPVKVNLLIDRFVASLDRSSGSEQGRQTP
jgi:pimeloyl-ACP methyl ester carboxylesterase